MPFCLSNVNTQTIHRSWRGRKTLFASFMQSMTRALHELGKGLSRGSEVGASSHGGSHVAQLRPPALGSDARAAGVWFNGTLSPLSSPLLLSQFSRGMSAKYVLCLLCSRVIGLPFDFHKPVPGVQLQSQVPFLPGHLQVHSVEAQRRKLASGDDTQHRASVLVCPWLGESREVSGQVLRNLLPKLHIDAAPWPNLSAGCLGQPAVAGGSREKPRLWLCLVWCCPGGWPPRGLVPFTVRLLIYLFIWTILVTCKFITQSFPYLDLKMFLNCKLGKC